MILHDPGRTEVITTVLKRAEKEIGPRRQSPRELWNRALQPLTVVEGAVGREKQVASSSRDGLRSRSLLGTSGRIRAQMTPRL